MRTLGAIFVALAIFSFAHGEYQASIYGMQALKVFCNTDVDLEFLHRYEDVPGFDFLRLARDPRIPVEVLVAPDRINQFKQDLDEQHIEYEVFVNDVSVIIERELENQEQARKLRTGAGISFESFPRYSEIKTYLESLSTKYSNIVETFGIGKTFEGREIVGIRISSNLDSIDKRVMVIDAGIHAREWIAPTTALYAINQLVENTTNHHYFKDLDIYVIPSLNVDGYEYTHRNASTRLWRKTRSVRSGLDCIGADANRNFDMAWMSIGASSNPCSETFAGVKAFSEPEAVALQEFMLSFGNRLKSFVSLHSYGNYILHPWGYTYDLPKNAKTMKCVADRAAAELFKLRGTGYTTGSKIAVLYATSGTSVDWAMGKTNTESSYTVELPSGEYGFVAPPSEILPVGRETFEAIKIFIRHAKGEIVCTGASDNLCSETCAGPKAFSEVETVALKDFLLSFKGAIKAYITIHSYGQYFLLPWGFVTTPPKTVKELKCVAEKAASELFKHRGTSYTIGSTMEALYPAAGISVDWAMAKAGADISYTIELPGGQYGFAPPPTEIVPVGRETFDALVVFIEYTKGVDVC